MIGMGFGIAIMLWAYVRIGDAYDQLDHYGVDRPSHASLGQGLAVLALIGFILTLVAMAQRATWVRPTGLAAGAAAALTGIYLLYVSVSHSDKIGFDTGGLRLLGVIVVAYGAVTAWRSTHVDLDT
jgi:hypothetical protein